jgi:FdhD protein
MEQGIDVQVTLVDDANTRCEARRRRSMAGPVGCGLCGIESIEQACAGARRGRRRRADASCHDIVARPSLLNERPAAASRDARGAWRRVLSCPARDSSLVREDVGRHNALDKLCGAVIGPDQPARTGVVVVTSRAFGRDGAEDGDPRQPVLIAISAPTALAIRTAEEAGMTLVALVRGEDFEIFTHPHRIQPGSIADVA